MNEADKGKIFGEYRTFTEEIKESGQYQAGSALRPTSTATTVRVRDVKQFTNDGPFAETKEQLPHCIIEAENLGGNRNRSARRPNKGMSVWRKNHLESLPLSFRRFDPVVDARLKYVEGERASARLFVVKLTNVAFRAEFSLSAFT
jgi:hypothetical protein